MYNAIVYFPMWSSLVVLVTALPLFTSQQFAGTLLCVTRSSYLSYLSLCLHFTAVKSIQTFSGRIVSTVFPSEHRSWFVESCSQHMKWTEMNSSSRTQLQCERLNGSARANGALTQWRQRGFKVGRRTTEWGRCGRGTPSPHPTPFGGSVGRVWATNIGLLYPKVRNNIWGIFPLTFNNQNIGDVSPASPAGLTPVH